MDSRRNSSAARVKRDDSKTTLRNLGQAMLRNSNSSSKGIG